MVLEYIFVIDDDPIVIYGMKKLLKKLKQDINICTFFNGKEAISAIKLSIKKKISLPDIIFLDINMPVMNGWEFLETLLTLNLKKKIKINIVSSTIDPEDLKKIESYKNLNNHWINFNNKPITAKEIKRLTRAA